MKKMIFMGSLLWGLNSCTPPVVRVYPPSPLQPVKIVYIVNHGQHTGIVIKRSEVQKSLWPELADFPNATYLEVGWGSADYYQTQQPTKSLGLKVLLFSSASVLYVTPLTASPEIYFPTNQFVAVSLSESGFTRLSEFIHNSYQHNAQGNALPVGHYGQGYFYSAQGQYHLSNNCNHWTASALKLAGYPITMVYAMTAGDLMSQLVQ